MMSKSIIVYCPPFDENSGGSIVLHYLVSRLREAGFDAYAFPWLTHYDMDQVKHGSIFKRLITLIKVERERSRFQTHATMDAPVAPRALLSNAVAVYPEVTSGNPLGCKHVARWFLNQKDFFVEGADFSENEMSFFFKPYRLEDGTPIDDEKVLRVRWIRRDIYFDRGEQHQTGSCWMLRKGVHFDQSRVSEFEVGENLDEKTHEEIANAFNQCSHFYCYDPYTMYLYYAALCGCVPIVVPPSGMTIDQWRPNLEERWGIAFGEENIAWARETRHLMIDRFEREHAKETESVRRFAKYVSERG